MPGKLSKVELSINIVVNELYVFKTKLTLYMNIFNRSSSVYELREYKAATSPIN